MTRDRDSILVRQPGLFVRLLSLGLLGFIFYSTTVEAAHKHDNLVEPATSARGAALSDDGTDGDVSSRLSGCDDCLICQLHQHFTTTLIPVRDGDAPKLNRAGVFAPTIALLSSRIETPRSGRAPPQAIQ